VHHRQPVREHVDPGQPTIVENVGAALGFEEGEPHQHRDMRHKLERMPNKFTGALVGRIGEDRLHAVRGALLFQEIDTAARVGAAIVHKVGTDDLISGRPQRLNDCAAAGGALPDRTYEGFYLKERMHGFGCRLV
jgi:hypothetical protein